MKVIYKYPIEAAARFKLELPLEYKILHVNVQNNNPFIWVLVDTDHPKETVWFSVFGTGHPMPKEHSMSEIIEPVYVGTFMLDEGKFVFHLFNDL